MKDNFIDDLNYFETKNKTKIKIIADNSLIIPEYIIDLQNKSKKTLERLENFSLIKKKNKINNIDEIKIKKDIKKSSFKKKKFYKKKFNKKKVK